MLASEFLMDWSPSRWSAHRLLVAVSGGADSVALLLALAELGVAGRLVVAHFNHGWRGQESCGDQRFVIGLARKLGLACVTNATATSGVAVSQFDLAESRVSAMLASATEEAGRRARYAFLVDAAYRMGRLCCYGSYGR